MIKLLLILAFLIICTILTLFYNGHFNKEISCQINGLAINNSIVDMTRNDIIKKIGQPTTSALKIKGFDEYSYQFQNKSYTAIFYYKNVEDNYHLDYFKCIKSQAKFEVANYVIWH